MHNSKAGNGIFIVQRAIDPDEALFVEIHGVKHSQYFSYLWLWLIIADV